MEFAEKQLLNSFLANEQCFDEHVTLGTIHDHDLLEADPTDHILGSFS